QQLVALGYVTVKEQRRTDGSRAVNLYRVVLDYDGATPQPDVDTPQPDVAAMQCDVDTPQPLEVATPQRHVDTPQLPEVAAVTSHKNYPIRTSQGNTHTAPSARRSARVLTTDQQERFDRWYAAYPKHEHRPEAVKAWQRLDPDDDLTDRMIADVAARQNGRKWSEGYIELPASYLNKRVWEDDIETTWQRAPERLSRDQQRRVNNQRALEAIDW
ncbi:MAG: hypothetical protein ACTHMU_08135, partial [Thermomicrobiales bacterium]